jgi:hypothetical protein
VSEANISGPRLLELLPVGGSHQILMTFSVPDVYLLSDIAEKVGSVAQLADFGKKFPLKQSAPFEFFRYENWDFASFGVKKPPIPEIELSKPPQVPPSAAAEALYKFLAFADIDPSAPPGYDEFTEYYEKNMITWHLYDTEAYLRHLYVIYRRVPAQDQNAVLPALEDEIRRHNKFIDANRRAVTDMSRHTRAMSEPLRCIAEKVEAAKSVLANQILTVFIQNNQQIASDLKAVKRVMFLQKSSFKEFFNGILARIRKFIQPIGEYLYPEVGCHLHSYLMQFLPLSEFQAVHNMLEAQDSRLEEIAEEAIPKYCVSAAPERLRGLFNFPSLFAFAVHAIKRAAGCAGPLDALGEIAYCIDLLTDLYVLEVDAQPTQEALTPLFNYVLLTSKAGVLVSVSTYIDHFLGDLLAADTPILDERLSHALSQFLSYIALFDQVLSTN